MALQDGATAARQQPRAGDEQLRVGTGVARDLAVQQAAAGPPAGVHQAISASPPPLVLDPGTATAWDVARHPRLFYEERHDAAGSMPDDHTLGGATSANGGIVLRWRQKEKLKTTAVALVLCLNIGVDPPDVVKISPCARLECWVDPASLQPAKALEAIGKNLQAQYERWQPKAKYKMHLDPTVDDVKKLVQSCRRNAKGERVLFHYNGHGVPRPTANGELWVFNARYTQYIPLSVYELQAWLGTPAIYVLDCSSAGMVINSFRLLMDQRAAEIRKMAAAAAASVDKQTAGRGAASASPSAAPGAAPAPPPPDPMREVIVLAACGAGEVLPQSPELPADVFTACLTTPIKVALRWFASRSLLRHDGITRELIDKIPGRQTDRKTPLGELNWIFTAITDTIAWNALPRALFQKLFRSDLLVASLFRNFLLAERIMGGLGCTPASLPRLPPTAQHPMWQAWDMAAEMCLMQLPTLLSDPAAEFQPSPFFAEQLTAFELWLGSGSKDRSPPEQLPIVLQVLLSQVHRLRALALLARFLDMGPWAVDLALSVGIFPYVLKLLQTTSADLRPTLVFIWSKVMALDRSCQADLVKDGGHVYFIRYLDADSGAAGAAGAPGAGGTGGGPPDPVSRAQAAFVLAAICDGHPKGQALCASNGLLPVLLRLLRAGAAASPPQAQAAAQQAQAQAQHLLLLKWLCLCLGKLCQDSPDVSLAAIRDGAADQLVLLITQAPPDVRAAAVFALGCLVHVPGPATAGGAPDGAGVSGASTPAAATEDRQPAEQLIATAIRQVVYDPAVVVRCELAAAYGRLLAAHAPGVVDALVAHQRRLQVLASGPGGGSASSRASVDGALTGQGGAASQQPPTPVYAGVVEGLLLLALDPSPRVARAGRAVLRAAHVELSFLGGGGPSQAGTGSAAGTAGGTGAATSSTATATSTGSMLLGHFAQKLRGAASSSVPGTPSTPGSPPAARGGSAGTATAAYDAAAAGPQALSRPPHLLVGSPAATPVAVHLLPGSQAYRAACDGFARPMLASVGPSSSSGHGGDVTQPIATVAAPPPSDPKRRAARLEAMAAGAARCRALASTPRAPRLRDQVFSLDTGSADGLAAAAFHPYHALLVTADRGGMLRVLPYEMAAEGGGGGGGGTTVVTGAAAEPTPIHTFHVTGSAAPVTGEGRVRVVHLQHICEADGPLLLACTADGAARVWRGHTGGDVRPAMAAAMQAVVINLPPGTGYHPASFAWQGAAGALYAAGGSRPDLVYVWDLGPGAETCVRMLATSAAGHGPAIDRLHLPPLLASAALPSASPHLMLASCADATLRLWDVRVPEPAPTLTLTPPFHSQSSGAAAGSNALTGAALLSNGLLVAASDRGELALMDPRGASGSAGADVTIKTLAVHSRGGVVVTLAAHGLAPLLATAATSSVVKVWTDGCDAVGSIRRAMPSGTNAAAAMMTTLVEPASADTVLLDHSGPAALAAGSGSVSFSGPAALLGGPGQPTPSPSASSAAAAAASSSCCLAWHPYQPLLVAGGWGGGNGDAIASIYAVDAAGGRQLQHHAPSHHHQLAMMMMGGVAGGGMGGMAGGAAG